MNVVWACSSVVNCPGTKLTPGYPRNVTTMPFFLLPYLVFKNNSQDYTSLARIKAKLAKIKI